MAQPYVGEIRMFAGNFAPAGWMFCEGQLLPISEYETLFNLIGTTYGGDGQETFALPDSQGRVTIHMGLNPSTGKNYIIGEKGGVETVTLTTQQTPIHTHALLASTDLALSADPTGNVLAEPSTLNLFFGDIASSNLNAQAITPVGGGQPHENL